MSPYLTPSAWKVDHFPFLATPDYQDFPVFLALLGAPFQSFTPIFSHLPGGECHWLQFFPSSLSTLYLDDVIQSNGCKCHFMLPSPRPLLDFRIYTGLNTSLVCQIVETFRVHNWFLTVPLSLFLHMTLNDNSIPEAVQAQSLGVIFFFF